MSEIPVIKLPENDRSDAKFVDDILNKIYDLRGADMERARHIFEMYLTELMEFVTLIGSEVITIPSTQNHVLAYFYNKDIVEIFGLRLVFDNDYSRRHIFLDKLEEYKYECLWNNRCLVYDIIRENGVDVYKLNLEMSNEMGPLELFNTTKYLRIYIDESHRRIVK